ncbi:MAG: helix-turn-helix domain-containing protein [Clostridiales bacterium]|nr:helix-turn-helix domain-containing protein [Clostridiales bacterium]
MTERKCYSMLKDYPEVLTVPEAAKVLRIGKNKAYELAKTGKLSTIQLAGKILVPKTRLVAFLMGEKLYEKNNRKCPKSSRKSLDFQTKMCYRVIADGDTTKLEKIN